MMIMIIGVIVLAAANSLCSGEHVFSGDAAL